MSKETIKMNSIRIMRIGVKALLFCAEKDSRIWRNTIAKNWDKEDDAECRKILYKAHKGLVKSRKIVRECQARLGEMKREMKKLNRQHDMRENAVKARTKERYKTTLLD